VVVTVDAVVYYQATDPVKLKYNVANFILAATKLAQTNLRNIVGELQLDEALTSRDMINTQLRQVLDEATDVWGTRVVRVEIQRIDPPPDITEAMHRQMKGTRPPCHRHRGRGPKRGRSAGGGCRRILGPKARPRRSRR
jgi:regulator of protease activity HflC (stomatin/prohibitin superfamily)